MLHNLVICLPSLTTLFWGLTLFFDKGDNSQARRFLSLFMMVAFVLYLCYIPYFNGQLSLFIYLLPVYTLASLLVYPMYFHYVCMITLHPSFQKKYLLHYIPALFYFVALSAGILMLPQKDVHALQHLMESNQLSMARFDGDMLSVVTMLFLSSRLVFGVLVVVTLYYNVKNIRRYNISIPDFFSNPESRRVDSLSFVLVAMAITSVTSMVFNLIGFQVFLHNDYLLAIPSVMLSSMLYVVGFVGSKQKQVCVAMKDDKYTDECDCSVVDSFDDKFVEQFNMLFYEKKIYLQQDLKIWDVCEAMNSNRTYISCYINKAVGLNFCSFVNKLRVENALILLSDFSYDIYSLNYIAEKSGFSSMNSFYRAFTKAYGVSPGKYRQVRTEPDSSNHQFHSENSEVSDKREFL